MDYCVWSVLGSEGKKGRLSSLSSSSGKVLKATVKQNEGSARWDGQMDKHWYLVPQLLPRLEPLPGPGTSADQAAHWHIPFLFSATGLLILAQLLLPEH